MQGQDRPGMKENPRNLYGQDSEPATMAFIHSIFIHSAENHSEKRAYYAANISAFSHLQTFIHSIHGQGHSTFFIQHYSISALFDSTGESSGDPYSRMSLRLRDLSHEGMACLEETVVSWFHNTMVPD